MKKINKKTIIAISGVAGSGKGSVWKVLRNYPEKFAISTSYTTREPREGEVEGGEYHFISDQEFDLAVKNNEFLEWEQVHLDRYGTKRKDFEKLIYSGKNPVLEIDVKGVKNIRKRYNNIFTVFITAPSLKVAVSRLKKRGTENEKSLNKRISRYNLEMKYAKDYDSIIVNDDLERARKELIEILKMNINR